MHYVEEINRVCFILAMTAINRKNFVLKQKGYSTFYFLLELVFSLLSVWLYARSIK